MGKIKNALKRFLEWMADKSETDKILAEAFGRGLWLALGVFWVSKGFWTIVEGQFDLWYGLQILFGAILIYVEQRRYRQLRKRMNRYDLVRRP